MNSEQERRESQSVEDARRSYWRIAAHMASSGRGELLAQSQAMLVSWVEPMTRAVVAEQQALRRGGNGVGRALYGRPMMACKAENAAYLAMREVISSIMDSEYGVTLSSVAHRVGRTVFSDMVACDDEAVARGRIEPLVRDLARNGGDGLVWESRACVALGSRLISLMIAVCRTDYTSDGHEAFTISRRMMNKRIIRFLGWTDESTRLLTGMRDARAAMRPRHRAMIVSPRLWSGGDGGYLTYPTPLISGATPEQMQVFSNTAMARDALDAVSQQAWMINEKVLSVAQTLWKTADAIPGLRRADVAPVGKQRMLALHQSASRRARWLWAMSAAHDLQGREFWLPHRLDWRGRMHPIPTDLSHHKSDFARSLMLFSHNGTDCDFHWLGIHAANCWGHDIRRAPYHTRALWASKHAGEMVAIGSDPLENKMWHNADDPWQFLAACIALHDPETYGCRLPIQFDHSANALQHLVAISRSEVEAAKVNMTESDSPVDPYTTVIQRVSRTICELAEASDEIATAALPYVMRRVLKRPIMATMYRVTRYGAAKQVYSSLPDDMPPTLRMKLSGYLADWSTNALASEFPAAMSIVAWIEDAARQILASDKKAVLGWHALSGLSVVQPYRRSKRTLVKTSLGSLTIKDSDPSCPPDKRRQIRGIVPNIIQSIEACALQATTIECAVNSAPIAGVHDCVWTTSDCAALVARSARCQFGAVHHTDPLSNMRLEWNAKYGIQLPPLPSRGNLDMQSVVNAKYLLS